MARKTRKPSDMSELFQSSKGTLAQIAAKTNSLTILSDIVRQTCPDLPADVWHIANFKQNSLVIEVTSAVWSQRLQFERMNICRELAIATDKAFDQIEIKVSPYRNKVVYQSDEKPAEPLHISQNTANQLLAIAKNAPESLRKKLEKLAKHADKNAIR
ncbi:DUF721 domain-containing protein [Colwellia hornerae]|uniref:DUF721 domain-containing protein n=1 Tax=Colwellia hornerae TaxID=89402 RepID=A0A5C6QTU9_9GAMM|nr:DciA family protein [Colwellia hornerae]TWX56936.1 DUF721 domain-containing protein [Colwellia hornerae]TWX62339.1 DUF721 domain-containing protein [Colwellia hornerae]TWX72329.1 DUF721 domain-containing protein [Colwellia hornerae]